MDNIGDYAMAFNSAQDNNTKIAAWQGARSHVDNNLRMLQGQYQTARAANDQNGMVNAHNAIKQLMFQYAQNFKSMEQARGTSMGGVQSQSAQPQPVQSQPVQSGSSPRQVQPSLRLPSHVRTT